MKTTNHNSGVRKRVLIKKDDLFNFVNSPDILKVEINQAQNKSLKDPNVICLYVYYKVDSNSFWGLIGSLNTVKVIEAVTPHDHAYLCGLRSYKPLNYIKLSDLNKISEIADKYEGKTGIGFSKQLKALVKKLNKEN